MSRFLREPLLHFLVIGAALFALYGALQGRSSGGAAGDQVIVVSAGQIEALAAKFQKFRQRPPSAAELQGLVDEYVEMEVLSREAMALGLDRDDSVIQRRLQQKMEFLAEDFESSTAPTDAELTAWLIEHAADYQEPARYSFRQIYFNPDRRGSTLRTEATALLARLRTSAVTVDVTTLGDSTLLPASSDAMALPLVERQFGATFAQELTALPVGEWAGPLRSAFGAHLIQVTAVTPARDSTLAEVRDAVTRDLMSARRRDAHARFVASLLAKYELNIEWPVADPQAALTTGPIRVATRLP